MNVSSTLLFSIILLLSTLLAGASSLAVSTSGVPTYQRDVRPILALHCLTCHGPRKSTKRQLDTYAAVSSKIDDILYRVQLPITNRKFMPYKLRESPLNQAEISLLKAWQAGGLLEK